MGVLAYLSLPKNRKSGFGHAIAQNRAHISTVYTKDSEKENWYENRAGNTHENIQYSCDKRDKSFSNKDTLNKHINTSEPNWIHKLSDKAKLIFRSSLLER